MFSTGKHIEYPRIYLLPRFNWDWRMGFFYVYWWKWAVGYIHGIQNPNNSAGWNQGKKGGGNG